MTFDDLSALDVDVVLYHGGCTDGFAAAWAVRQRFPEAVPIPVRHGEDPPDVSGKVVAIVDFSYGLDATAHMIQNAKFLIMLDHHETALKSFGHGDKRRPFLETSVAHHIEIDTARSGAGMAWDFFLGRENRPNLIDYVEDRDLWRWKLKHSREINAYIGTVAHEFAEWDALDISLGEYHYPKKAADTGAAVLRRNEQLVNRICSKAYPWAIYKHYAWPGIGRESTGLLPTARAVNSPVLQSEIGNQLALESEHHGGLPVGLVWWYDPDLLVAPAPNGALDHIPVQVSLRSVGDFDVSLLAQHYGGGGHPNSAGCVMKLEDVR